MVLTESSSRAWMIRNDGKAIPVLQHLYGNSKDVEETLYAGEWLYNNTQYSYVKRAFIELVVAWVATIADTSREDRVEKLIEQIEQRPYKIVSTSFVSQHAEEIRSADVHDLGDWNGLVCAYLNQEFLRARCGGMYNSIRESNEIVFRISSIDFDWFDIIYKFVSAGHYSTVTVVRDAESTGTEDLYYKWDSDVLNRIAVDEFLLHSGHSPLLERNNAAHRYHELGELADTCNVNRLLHSLARDSYRNALQYYKRGPHRDN